MQYLVENGATVDAAYKDSQTLLIAAAEAGHERIVCYLLNNQISVASIKAKGKFRQTTLVLATKR